jgi:hypothetical protein
MKLQDASLDAALSHLEKFGDTDLLPNAFEIEAIRFSWPTIKAHLAAIDINNYTSRTSRRCLAPKGKYSFRVVTQLDPLDAILWTALVIEMGAGIEKRRPSVRSGRVHSHRFDAKLTDGRLYLREWNYSSFRAAGLKLAGSGQYSHVVCTDIADFYPRLYLHPLENSLAESGNVEAAKAMAKLVKSSNLLSSYGLPVGVDAARLLSEATIIDIDELLAHKALTYIRYSDDFQFFAKSETEAQIVLADFARNLYEMHGLTLQVGKTAILPIKNYIDRYGESEQDAVDKSERARIQAAVDLHGEYGEQIELSEDEVEALAGLNLFEMLAEQLGRDHPDLAMCRLLLSRIALAGLVDTEGLLLANVLRIPSLVPGIAQALASQRHPADDFTADSEGELFALADRDSLGFLEFTRSWALSRLIHPNLTVRIPPLNNLYEKCSDTWTRREVMLLLARRKASAWFRSKRHEFQGMNPWERRAFLLGAVHLSGDESKFFLKSVGSSLDPLEKAVVTWAQAGELDRWAPLAP